MHMMAFLTPLNSSDLSSWWILFSVFTTKSITYSNLIRYSLFCSCSISVIFAPLFLSMKEKFCSFTISLKGCFPVWGNFRCLRYGPYKVISVFAPTPMCYSSNRSWSCNMIMCWWGMGKLNFVSHPSPDLVLPLKVGGRLGQQMLYFPVQKRSKNPTEASLEVYLQTTGGRSHPVPVCKHRPLALRAIHQTTQNNFPDA